MRTIRLNWPALVVAMIVSFLFQAAWFGFFLKPWLAAIGHDMQWLESRPGVTMPVQYAVALLCSFIGAAILSISIQASGEQTLFRGIKVAAVLWFGFVLTTFAKNDIFEVRPISLFAINAAYTLIDLVLMGAIVGAWKGKPRAIAP